jgi:hypothetical protein
MRNRTRIALVAVVAAIAVPAVVIAATNAYTSPTLKVRYAGAAAVISASAASADDATARAAIYVPAGTTVTATQAPGTQLGTVNAQVSALALGGALLPLTGPIIVAPPGAVPAASQTACIQSETPSSTWLLQLAVAGQAINLPAYLIPTAGNETALGPAKLVFCLAPPDIPAAQGGAANGAKFLSAELTVNGVFSSASSGVWLALWTPWQAGNGQINLPGTVASPAAIAPGAVTIAGRKNAAGRKILTGRVTQAGAGFAGRVAIWGAVNRASFRRLATVTARAGGTYSYTVPRASRANTFQARVASPSRAAPSVCAAIGAQLGGIPCVNPTVSGFTARSRNVTVR